MATPAANPLSAGVTAELYRAAIGPRGQDYYLRQFTRFEADGRAGTSWNWPAYWATLNWLMYRKMWGWALAYLAAVLGLALLIFGVGKLVLDYSDTSALLLFLLLLTAAFVVPGLYANAWFYKHCTDRITGVLRNTPDVKQAVFELARQAPDSRRALALALANAGVLALVLTVVNWFQSADSHLPLLATHEERPLAGGQSGQVRPLAAGPAVRVASARAAGASAPAVAASAAAMAVVSAPAVVPAAPAVPAAASVATGPSPLMNTSDRTLAPVQAESTPALSAAAPAASASAAATAAAAVTPEPVPAAARPALRASAPRVHYVWVIQVGAYAEDANAQSALAQVQALGLEAGTESFDSPKGRLTRVRVGPYTRKAEASKAALRIKSLNLPVLVIRQRP